MIESVTVPDSAEELILAITFDPSSGRYAVIRDGLIIGRYSSYVRALEVLEGDQEVGDEGPEEGVLPEFLEDVQQERAGVAA